MSEGPSDDLARLFTPPGTPLSSVLSEVPSTPAFVPPKARQTETFFIELPVLGSAEKSQYKTLPTQFVASGVEFDAPDVDQVIGEYREGTDLYYFARFQDGIAHKFHAKWFRSQYGELVKDYEQKKEAGTLAPFDPSGHNVHPRSRIRNTIIIKPKRAFAKNPALKSVARNNVKKAITIDDSEPEEIEDSDDEDGSDDSDYGVRPRRRSRATKKPVKDLPFSPKKKRARKGFVVPDTDEEDEDDGDGDESEIEEFVPARRSSRSTKNAKAKYIEADDYVDDEDEGGESEDDDHKPRKLPKAQKPKTEKIVRGKASRPAYGNVRHVVDLDYDVLSDEETAPLRAHRAVCEKCHKGPAHHLIQAAGKKPKGRGRKKKDQDLDDFEGDEMERLTALGGWVRCLKCPVTAHWGCLASTQRHEILKAAQDRDRELLESAQAERRAQAAGPDGDNDEGASTRIEVKKRSGLTPNQTTEFICGSCMKGGICMGCLAVVLQPDTSAETKKDIPPGASVNLDGDFEMADSTQNAQKKQTDESTRELTSREILFRCFTCKRLSHYEHLPVPPEYSEEEAFVDSVMLAEYYQSNTEWHCSDCFSYKWELDKILAWRPYPSTAVEPPHPPNEPPHYKSALPREYLVKWLSRSYRRTQWVPHMWLVTTHAAKLKNFLNVGAKVELLEKALPDEDAVAVDDEAEKIADEGNTTNVPFEISADADQDSTQGSSKSLTLPLGAMPDAERRIPLPWKTIDRVLDVLFLRPTKRKDSHLKKKTQGNRKGKKTVPSSEDGDEDENPNDALHGPIKAEVESAFAEGEQPSYDLTETVREWETRTGRIITTEQIKNVVWVFIKWDDLPHDEATWDSPPRKGKFGYSAFETAFKRFVDSRQVHVMKLTKDEIKALDKRPKDEYKRKYALNRQEGEQPVLGQSQQLSLMPFQIDGVNWLCDNWWRLQHCILADEMGLGKTVQIVTFLGTIIGRWQGFPALVVVPNSTITNWVREFERWAPNLRIVPFYGEMKSREIIKQFELEHEVKKPGTTGAKFHVLVTTYESLNNPKDFTRVFKSIPRWEVLIVDEGQRLKNDSSLLFRKLNELRSIHRIIMTGTPLNNNMRELFNLMNFLDPIEWRDLEALEKEHEALTDDLIKQLHERLRPYFLRRIKSEVLQLPPKNEVIVPVSMAPLQKEVYRSVLSKNLDILKSLAQPSKAKINTTVGKLNNMLMQLRKCLQHPYLINDDIEPRGLSVQETQYKLIDGSAKLRFLKSLLPQLKARGHRILLFSQFVIALDIVEDFLHGEGFKYLRLDGNTKQADRQKGMDAFNAPQSDVFIYLLTTRAGGVGINLWSADTVIIFDPDFNPHQDLQAIARAHRYGQQKAVLVFKLMVKDSAEERIMQTGKKKLVLDHLIVQKMDDEDSAGDDVQSILTFGAKALFEEGDQGAHDIIYTDHDIEKLIERTEKEGDLEQPEKKEGLSFSFAKIWAADKDTLEELIDDTTQSNDQDDSWAQTLARIAAERDKVQAQEVTGRGVRRRAAAAPQPLIDFDDTPVKGKKKSHKSKSKVSDESDGYTGSAFGVSDGDETDDAAPLTSGELLALIDEVDTKNETPKRTTVKRAVPASTSSTDPRYRDAGPLSPIHNTKHNGYEAGNPVCSLCGIRHGDDACYMTESSENLAEYRQMLILHADDEPIEDRQAAVRVIDETLYKRGKMHLIDGQPLHLLDKPSLVPNPLPKKKSKHAHASASAIQHSTSNGKAAASTFPVDLSPRLIASSSKRTSSPLPSEGHSSKKQKFQPSPSHCAVCSRSPFHLVKDCPTVLEGPKSVSKAIRRLEDDPKHTSTVYILNKILKKQKRRELAQSSSDAIMVND